MGKYCNGPVIMITGRIILRKIRRTVHPAQLYHDAFSLRDAYRGFYVGVSG